MQDEVRRFRDRQSGRDFSEDGPPRPLRETSLKTREYQLRIAVSALVISGVDASELVSLSQVLTVERFKRILQVLLDRREGKTSSQVGQIASFLTSVARHWLKADDATLAQMRKLTARVSVNQKGMTAKNRIVLLPMGTFPSFSDELYAFYRERARGGTGILMMNRAKVSPAGLGGRSLANATHASIWDDRNEEGWKRLAGTITENGGRAVLQIDHEGIEAG